MAHSSQWKLIINMEGHVANQGRLQHGLLSSQRIFLAAERVDLERVMSTWALLLYSHLGHVLGGYSLCSERANARALRPALTAAVSLSSATVAPPRRGSPRRAASLPSLTVALNLSNVTGAVPLASAILFGDCLPHGFEAHMPSSRPQRGGLAPPRSFFYWSTLYGYHRVVEGTFTVLPAMLLTCAALGCRGRLCLKLLHAIPLHVFH